MRGTQVLGQGTQVSGQGAQVSGQGAQEPGYSMLPSTDDVTDCIYQWINNNDYIQSSVMRILIFHMSREIPNDGVIICNH